MVLAPNAFMILVRLVRLRMVLVRRFSSLPINNPYFGVYMKIYFVRRMVVRY